MKLRGSPPGYERPDCPVVKGVTICTFSYTYNGEVLDAIMYPDILAVKYAYDGLGRVTSATRSGTTTSYAKLSYHKNDQVREIEYGNGLTASYVYDQLSRPSAITVNNPAASGTLLSLTHGYHPMGAVSSITGQVNSLAVSEQYTYDAFRRLTDATVNTGVTSTALHFDYDSAGNRLRQTVGGIATEYGYDLSNDRLTSTRSSGPSGFVGSIASSYYADGTLKSRNITTTAGTTRWGFTWDTAGRLFKVISDATTKGVYAYDPLGRRLESVEGGTATFYAYLGPETLYEKTGFASTDYIYAGGVRVAKVTSGTASYYHTDHLGSTRLVTSQTKSVIYSDSYQPFGQDNGSPTCTGTCEKHKFTGKPYSSATGLYYYYQRWYDNSTGRFFSQDSILGSLSYPQTLNRYTYTVNNPVQYVDPTGEIPILVFLLVAVVLAGVGVGATLSPELAQYTDPAMTGVGVIPILGDFTADPYFAARSTSSCALGMGCDQFQTGLDIAVLLPVIPGALARGKRIANLVDATVDLNRGVSRTDLLRMINRADFAPRLRNTPNHLAHVAQLGFRNSDEYVAGARSLLRQGVEGQAELYRIDRGRDLAAVIPGTGKFTVLNTQTGFIRTFFEHPGGYAHIDFLRKTQGWIPFYVR